MALICPNVAEVILLEYLLNKVAPTNVVLHLYKAIAHPESEDTVLSDLTEATETGYGTKTLVGATWTISTVAGTTTATYPEQTFTFSEGSDIYGYYVTSNGNLLWLERFDGAPFQLPDGGGTIAITPKIELA